MFGLALISTLLAVTFSVLPLTIPQGFTAQLTGAFDEGRRPTVLAPPITVSMSKTGDALILVSRRDRVPATGVFGSVPRDQRLLIFRPHRLPKILVPPNGLVFASQPFGVAAQLDAERHPVFPDLQVACAVVSDTADIFVTQWHYFDGAYAGTELWPFSYANGRWSPVPALRSMNRGSNLIVTASSTGRQIGYAVNHEDAGDYAGSDAQNGITDRDEAWVMDGDAAIRVGDGTISAVSNHTYVGYDTHFFPAMPHFRKPPDAFAWSRGRKLDLGHGLTWAVNAVGVVVGDNRSAVTSMGVPVAWKNGRLTPLTDVVGSAFGINDRNQIVGDVQAHGGFLARLTNRGVSFNMLDNILAAPARGWHIEHAYAIANDGSILALGKFANRPESPVRLVPSL